MSYNYNSYQDALTALMVTSKNADFQLILPSIIDYAEQRIYRDLNLLSTVTSQNIGQFTPNNRKLSLALASSRIIVVKNVNVITPEFQQNADNGKRNALLPVAKEWLDAVWNSSLNSSVPQYYAMIDDQTIIVGPWPDKPYSVEVIGIVRPAPLYINTSGTYLSLYLPDLFMAASMVFASGYQKNFGAQGDDPRTAMSWEMQYNALKTSALNEDIQKKMNDIVRVVSLPATA